MIFKYGKYLRQYEEECSGCVLWVYLVQLALQW